jgi:hypothetical protein
MRENSAYRDSSVRWLFLRIQYTVQSVEVPRVLYQTVCPFVRTPNWLPQPPLPQASVPPPPFLEPKGGQHCLRVRGVAEKKKRDFLLKTGRHNCTIQKSELKMDRHNRRIQKSELKTKKQDHSTKESELKTDRHNRPIQKSVLKPRNRIGR